MTVKRNRPEGEEKNTQMMNLFLEENKNMSEAVLKLIQWNFLRSMMTFIYGMSFKANVMPSFEWGLNI